jgi:hypothetical protein
MKTGWGGVFKEYPLGAFPNYKEVKEWDPY